MDLDLERYKKPWLYTKITVLLVFALIIMLSKDPEKTSHPFDPPDPSKGMPIGFDYEKQEYRYHTEYQGPPLSNSRALEGIQTEIDIDDIYDLLDYYGD
jgi:hypothetical protein